MCIVMLIPITMLWGVQMRLAKKLTLAFIFSLVVITIIIATIRIIAITSSGLVDPSWAFFLEYHRGSCSYESRPSLVSIERPFCANS